MNYCYRKTEYCPCGSFCDVKPLETNHCYINMYMYMEKEKGSSTFKLEIAVTSNKMCPHIHFRANFLCQPPTDVRFSYRRILMDPVVRSMIHLSYPHMHTRRTDTAGPEGGILRSQEKNYHSADRTGDARCPCNACEIARISCSNPKKVPRRPHYYRAAALLCEYFADFVRARCSNKRK